MNNYEKRMANTEYAIIALWNMISDMLTDNPEKLMAVDRMIGDYFDANESLGADFSTTHVDFYKGHEHPEAELDKLNMDVGENNANDV